MKEAESILFSKLTYLQLISNFFMQMEKFVKCSRCLKEVSLAQTLFKVMFKYAYQWVTYNPAKLNNPPPLQMRIFTQLYFIL